MVEIEEKNPTSILLAEYEDVIHSMQTQLEVTKSEHRNLKEELFQLIAENQNLSSKLDAEYRDRINETVDGNFSDGFKSEIVVNLQNQLDVCKKEKQRILELYKVSLKLIEKLEEEVSSQQGNLLEKTQSQVLVKHPAVSVLEVKLKNTKEHLDLVLNEREKLESESIRQETEIAKLKLNLESNNKIIDQLKIKEEEWRNKCLKSEQDYTLLNSTFECVVQARDELEKKLEIYSVKIHDLVQKNNESRSKVEEALDVVEKVLAEKESASIKEMQLQEEINKLHLCLEHVIDEAGKKVGKEVEETTKKFNLHIEKLQTELTEVKGELERKKQDHKKLSLKYKKLEKLTSAKLDKEKISLIKGSEIEITTLENRLDSVYQELEKFKSKYDEVSKEKKKLEEEFSELVEKHQSLMTEKESREAFFEETVSELKCQIDRKIEDLNEASKRTEFFLNQVRDFQLENKELKRVVKACSCEKLKARIKKLNELGEKQRTELEAHIESQMRLNETWKSEIKEITEKFEGRIRKIKKECSELKAKNAELMSELKAAKKKIFSLENV